MATKKNFTKADGAIDKFFSPQQYEGIEHNTSVEHNAKHHNHTNNDTQHTNNDNVTNNTNNDIDTSYANNTNVTNSTNRSKHYNERGKRAERFGLLLDVQLKEDLRHLSMARGNKSINDFIVSILLEYVEREENQMKLERYRKLLQE